jgi:hypothetical protein
LEWLKNIREDHVDLTKKIEEMKQALNKDIDKFPQNALLKKHDSSSHSSNYG